MPDAQEPKMTVERLTERPQTVRVDSITVPRDNPFHTKIPFSEDSHPVEEGKIGIQEADEMQRQAGLFLRDAFKLDVSNVLDVGWGRNADPVDAMLEGTSGTGVLVDYFPPDDGSFNISYDGKYDAGRNTFLAPQKVGKIEGRPIEIYNGDFSLAVTGESPLAGIRFSTILFHGSLLPEGHSTVPSMTAPKYSEMLEKRRKKIPWLEPAHYKVVGSEDPDKVLDKPPTEKEFTQQELNTILENAHLMLNEGGKIVVVSPRFSREHMTEEGLFSEKRSFANIIHLMSKMGATRIEILGLDQNGFIGVEKSGKSRIKNFFKSVGNLVHLKDIDELIKISSIDIESKGDKDKINSERKKLAGILSRSPILRIDAVAFSFGDLNSSAK